MPVQKDDKSKQYFIAFIPPSPVLEEAQTLKEHFQERYHSKAALNSPPHITLHMPFRWKEEKEQTMIEQLKEFVKRFDPVKLCLDNFGSFPPRVIFLNVVKSVELNVVQKEIQQFCKREFNLFNANYREEPYHPHLTLAFRDLKKSAYHEAWGEFKSKEYKAEFVADKIALLKHDGKKWNVLKEFLLESSYSTSNDKRLETTEG
jgi:2'-5' RNA ligase